MRTDIDLQAPDRPQSHSERHNNGFQIGCVSVGITAKRAEDVVLAHPLAAFQAQESDPDIRLSIEWIPTLRSTSGQALFDSGSVWRLHQEQDELHFDFWATVLGDQPFKRLVVDRRFSKATLQLNRHCLQRSPSPVRAFDYPLDELLIMHRLTQEKAIELHACGIVWPDGTGNLFVGHSGAGKSTTTRLWTAHQEVEVLSDDRIIVRLEEGQQNHSQLRMYGTPWHGEARYASPASAPVSRIFILEHGLGNLITPLSSSRAVAELFARSFVPFHRHEYVESALMFLEELARAAPVYRYAFEPDERAVDTILNFHD